MPEQDPYLKGYWTGYHEGETERIWLATANSELRTEVLALQQQRDELLAKRDELISFSMALMSGTEHKPQKDSK